MHRTSEHLRHARRRCRRFGSLPLGAESERHDVRDTTKQRRRASCTGTSVGRYPGRERERQTVLPALDHPLSPKLEAVCREAPKRVGHQLPLAANAVPPITIARPRHRTHRSSSALTPSVRSMPVWPCNDKGCRANERPEPPNNTLAPTPTPAVALPLAPT
jgi:hypothetical protein